MEVAKPLSEGQGEQGEPFAPFRLPMADGYRLRTLVHILRIEGLLPFTGAAILLGFVVSLWEVGFQAADWGLFCIAVFAAVLVHIDAHLWNDILDLEVDRREIGRRIAGWALVSATVGLILRIIEDRSKRVGALWRPFSAAPRSPTRSKSSRT
jgi:hypothetical protein